MKKIKYCLLALLCPFVMAAQAIKSLKVGDELPALTLNNMINYHAASFDLSDYSEKLLIIDFWATWCSSCFKKFPVLDSLQTAYYPHLQVLLVSSVGTGDNPKRIKAFFEKRVNPAGQPYKMATLVKDSLLKQLFPHSMVPHYIWVYKNKIIAITGPADVTACNVESVLKGCNTHFNFKDDSLKQDKNKTK